MRYFNVLSKRFYPNIDIELILEEKFSDLVGQRIDVGFRSGASPDAQVITRRLFPIMEIPCASPSFLEEYGTPKSLDSLNEYKSTCYRSPSTGRLHPWEFKVNGEIEYKNMSPVLSTNDPEAEMEAVIAGFGIGLIDSINAIPRIRSKELIPLFCENISDREGLHIYYMQRENMPYRVRLFINFAIEKLLNSEAHVMHIAELLEFERSFVI